MEADKAGRAGIFFGGVLITYLELFAFSGRECELPDDHHPVQSRSNKNDCCKSGCPHRLGLGHRVVAATTQVRRFLWTCYAQVSLVRVGRDRLVWFALMLGLAPAPCEWHVLAQHNQKYTDICNETS